MVPHQSGIRLELVESHIALFCPIGMAIGAILGEDRLDLLAKMGMLGRDLADYSLDTVKMFYADAGAAGYKL